MSVNLEKRVAALEQQLAKLLQQPQDGSNSRAWVDDLYGKFAGDPVFKRAMNMAVSIGSPFVRVLVNLNDDLRSGHEYSEPAGT